MTIAFGLDLNNPNCNNCGTKLFGRWGQQWCPRCDRKMIDRRMSEEQAGERAASVGDLSKRVDP